LFNFLDITARTAFAFPKYLLQPPTATGSIRFWYPSWISWHSLL